MPNKPIVNSGVQYCSGMRVRQDSNTSLIISKGRVRDHKNVTDIILKDDVKLSPFKNGIGPNGIDSGVITGGSVYHVFAIGDSTNKKVTATLLSLSPDSPSLPPGYDSYNRITTTFGDISNPIQQFGSTGGGINRAHWHDSFLKHQVLSGGTSTSLADVDCSAHVPVFATRIYMSIKLSSVNEENTVTLNNSGSAPSYVTSIFSQDVSTLGKYYETSLSNTGTPASFRYKISATLGDTANIYIRGFDYNVGI